ncbi:MAG: DoxX family protein [Thermoleophilia bacterium]
MTRLRAWLTDPGSPSWAAVALRVVLGLVFLQAGLGKFVNYDEYVDRFDRWGFGFAPGAMAILVGIVETLGALALLTGVLPRVVSVVLIGNMVGAVLTAGRVEGGGTNVWLPLVLIVLLAVLVAVGSRRYALLPALPARLLPGGRSD